MRSFVSGVLMFGISLLPYGCSNFEVTRGVERPLTLKQTEEDPVKPPYERRELSEGYLEIWRSDFNGDGVVDDVMERRHEGRTMTDRIDVNNDGKFDIHVIIRYEDGRVHVDFDGDGNGVFEESFYMEAGQDI